MLVTQKQLDGQYEFEFKIQETGSRGRGKIYHIYREPDNVEGEAFLVFKMSLVQKLRDVADRLLDSIESAVTKKGQEESQPDAGYEWVIPPVEMAPGVDYGVPETQLGVGEATEILAETEMEGGYKCEVLVDLEANAVVEIIAKSAMVD